MKNQNILLLCMLLSYSITISYIYLNYFNNNSISNIISNKNCNYKIFIFMFIMGIFTILYEIIRNDYKSLFIISFLLLGIYGIIYIDETNKFHYLFATIIFLSIIFFMIHHYYITNNNILLYLLYLQILLLSITILSFGKKLFFLSEVFFILNFAIYYLYLHILSNIL